MTNTKLAAEIERTISEALAKCPAAARVTEERRKLADVESKLAQARQREKDLVESWKQQRASQPVADANAEEFLKTGKLPTVPVEARFLKQIDAARQEINIIERAAEMQKVRFAEANRALQVEAGKHLRPAHEKMVSRMAAAIRELSEACEAEEDFRWQLDAQQIGFPNMRPLGFPGGFRLDIEFSQAVNWFAEAKEYGYLTR